MNLEQYKKQKLERLTAPSPYRTKCMRCRKPSATCICSYVRPFKSGPQFVILIHRDEARRNIATGRMAHLCLENSLFYEGTDFTEHSEVNSLIQDAQNHCVVLFPGKNATSISRATAGEYYQSIAKKKRLVIFVIDGTWAQAKRMRRLSQNLHGLPHLAFLPETPSHFLVRQQPAEFCYSTIESIHSMIDWMEKRADKRHENLLEVFSRMVNQQVQYEMHYGALRGFCPTRGLRVTSKVELPPA